MEAFGPLPLPIPWPLVVAAAAAGLVLLVALMVVARLIRNLRRAEPPRPSLQRIEVAALAEGGPPSDSPWVEIYGTPVRLALIVLAPVGRDGVLPPEDQIPELLGDLVPELEEVVRAHAPALETWPEQLSSQGFLQAFFGHVVLPGDRGKGTPWCSVAGKFDSRGRQYLAGLVCCAAKTSALSQHTIEHEGQWLDVVRVRQQG